MEYKIVFAGDQHPYYYLEEIVNELMSKGWEPLGSPFVINNEIGQAMINKNDDKSDD